METYYGVFFEDDKDLTNPIYKSQFMTLAEAYAIINQDAFAHIPRKLVVKPIAKESDNENIYRK